MSFEDNMLLSIIIPTHNSANTLIRCLQSVVEQKCSSFEVLIIDSLSSDGTVKILENYTNEYSFIHFISEPDRGIYDAMNKGIEMCSGEWIYFLGSDDTLYNNNVLAFILSEIKYCADKVIYGNVVMRGVNQWNLNNVVFNGKYNLEKLIITNICHQAIFYHKSLFQLYGNFNLNYTVSADQDFNLRCYSHTSFTYIDIVIANFYVGGHSTTVYDAKFHNDRPRLLLRYFKNRIFEKSFLNARLYLRQGAFSSTSQMSVGERLYCLLAYSKLKFQAIVEKSLNSYNHA